MVEIQKVPVLLSLSESSMETKIIEKARRAATLKTLGLAIAQILSAYDRQQRLEIVREVQRLLQCTDKIC